MLPFDEVMRLATGNVGRNPQELLKRRSQMALPQLQPAPVPSKVQRLMPELRYTSPPRLLPAPTPLNDPLPNESGAISWADLVAEQRFSISELQKTIKVHEATINQKEVEYVRLQEKCNDLEAEQRKHFDQFGAQLAAADKRAQKLEEKNVRLQNAKLVAAKKAKQENSRFQKQLKESKAEKKKDIDRLEAELATETEKALKLEAENGQLRTELGSFRAQQHLPVSGKRCKQLHKCQNCEYATTKSYAMKVHREEGCKSAKVVKTLKCEICHRDVTHNTYRYHLNQYAKQSSHAKNGHENFTPAQHVEMLAKLNKTKR